VFAAFLCTIFFAVSSVCGHRSAKLIGGTEANFWRLSLASLLLGCWAFGTGTGLSGPAFPLLFISGVIGIGLGDVAFFQALPRLGPRVSSLLVQCITAPLGALIEWQWLGTHLTWAQFGFVLVIIGGVAVALSPGAGVKISRSALVKGAVFVFIAAAGTAIGAVLSRKAYAVADGLDQPIDGATAAFQRIVSGTLFAGIALLLVKRRMLRVQKLAPHHLVVEVSRHKWSGVWPWVTANAIAGQTLGVSLMQWALKTSPTGVVLAIVATTPVMIIPVAWVMDGERPTWHGIIGGAIAVSGIVGLTLLK
jgi:drug/metabolite transporter (DMT)-like permease